MSHIKADGCAMKGYRAALRRAATGIFTGPWETGFWPDLWRALDDAGWHLFVLVTWLLSIATYPVSIFLLAWLAVYSDAKLAEANREADEEWFKGMSGGIDGDE